MSRGLVYFQTEAPKVIVREGATRIGLATKAVPASGNPTTRRPWAQPRLSPRLGATTAKPAQIAGDPIVQLNRTRNMPVSPDWRALPRAYAKRADLEGIGNVGAIPREGDSTRHRRRLQIHGARRQAIAAAGGQVVLGINGSGMEFYKGVRVKPALPGGRADVSAATVPVELGTSTYIGSTMPAGVAASLAGESHLAASSTVAAGFAEVDAITPSPVALKSAMVLSGEPSGADKAGQFLFMLAALFVAWKVLK